MEQKYSDILKLNKKLGNNFKSSSYNITILSNFIVHQIKELLEYRLRKAGLNTDVEFGDYDNIVQDSYKYKESNAIIIFWELCNIIDTSKLEFVMIFCAYILGWLLKLIN